jgi:thiamine pyrophosphate-dependent acetolactate synthase large subunit-like protein
MFAGHRCNLGIIGSFSTSVARRHIDQADCVVAVGASLNCFTSSFGTSVPAVPLIQIDADRASVGRWLNADVALIGDARAVTTQLLDALPERASEDRPFHAAAVLDAIASFDIRSDFQAAHGARTVDPRSLGLALDALLPAKRNLVYDAGNFLGVVPYLTVPGPDHFKLTTDFASIGIGFGAALGFARARPDHTTVLVIGDGGLMMTISELETAAREDLPLVVVVMNDCAYGAELHVLKMRQLPVERSIFADIDFAPVAEGFAFEAATVRSLADLDALAPMLADPQGPLLLDCKINPNIMSPFMSEIAAAQGHGD